MGGIRHNCRISCRITGHERSSRSHLVEICSDCSPPSSNKEPELHAADGLHPWGVHQRPLELSQSERKSRICRPASFSLYILYYIILYYIILYYIILYIIIICKGQRGFVQIESTVSPSLRKQLQLRKYKHHRQETHRTLVLFFSFYIQLFF